MCRLEIDYTKLTPEEFQLMIWVLGKSKHLNIPSLCTADVLINSIFVIGWSNAT
ncbi:MAG: hypothetical protein ACYDG2_02385 [Ruminiclostridium sp.]